MQLTHPVHLEPMPAFCEHRVVGHIRCVTTGQLLLPKFRAYDGFVPQPSILRIALFIVDTGCINTADHSRAA
jgi:hypothetical protein